MAEFGQYNNYPTYPGLGPWFNSHFEKNLTEDYRIDGRNIPSTRVAIRDEIFSSEYGVSSWFGPILPIPSFVLSGGISVATLIITIRGSYWNWFNTGKSILFSSLTESEYSGIRPPTFHYQIRDEYKETVHYGFDMLIVGRPLPSGTVQILRIDSFIPFLEHRTQSTFERAFIRDGKIASVRIVDDDNFLISMNGISEIPSGHIVLDSVLNMDVYFIDEDGDNHINQLLVKEINADGSLVVSRQGVDEGFDSAAPDSYFILNHPIQVSDPTIAYSEIEVSESYWEETSDGFKTREQSPVASTDRWTSLLYNLELVKQVAAQLLEKAVNDVATAVAAKDTEAVSKAKGRVVTATKIVTYLDTQNVVAEEYAEVRRDSEDISPSVFLAVMQEIGQSTINLRLPIRGSSFVMNNFHAGTQDGSFLRITDSDGQLHVYPVFDHIRNEIFTLPVTSITSSKSLYDILADEDGEYVYDMYSPRMWQVTDITTGKGGGGTTSYSLDRGSFVGEIDSVEIEEVESEDGGGPTRLTSVWYKIDDDRDYYGIDYLVGRYFDDPDPEQGTIKAWKKFSGWNLYRRSYERTEQFSIIDAADIFKNGERFLLLTLDAEYEELADDTVDLGEFWIGFNDLIDVKPTSFDYVSLPFLGLNAFLSEGDGVTGDDSITFEGIYVGSPVGINLPDTDATLSLIEDNPVIFPNVGIAGDPLIKVSSSKAFKYISFNEDDPDDTEVILYNRDDDDSNALYARRGRVDYKYDIGESLLFLGNSEEVDTTVTQSQAVTLFDGPSENDVDVVGIRAVKKNLTDQPPQADSEYNHTIWTVYQGDRNLGYRSQSGKENSFLTRATGEGDKSDSTYIGLYHNSEYFSKGRGVTYSIPGNMLTGDASASGQFRFVTVRPGDFTHSEFASAKLQTVDSDMVLRDVKSHAILPHDDGQLVIMANQPQWRYLGDDGAKIDTVELVDGTESKRAAENELPSISSVDMSQDGIFMMSTTDMYRSFVSGLFIRPQDEDDPTGRGTLFSDPYLLSKDMAYADYAKVGRNIDVAGYSKIVDESGSEVTALIHRRHNVDAMFARPIFRYKSGDDTAFLTANTAVFDNVVIGNTSDTDIEPLFVMEDLDPEPTAMAADSRYSIIVFRNSNNLSFAISTTGGKRWSLFDDVFLANDTGRIAGPSVRIDGDWLLLFYYVNRVDLMYKRISLVNVVKMHRKYMKNLKSSEETDEETIKVKEELQALLDNTESVKVADSFEQKVSFGINSRNVLHVVYYDADGRVASAESTTHGIVWDINPVNF